MEVFGEDSKCNRLMRNIWTPLNLEGHSVNLLDNYLVIAATGISGEGWWYHSLEDARGGLLANPWKHTKTLGKDAPMHHVSFVYGKDLILLGGTKGTQVALQNGREENGEWNALRLTLKKNGVNFEQFPEFACVVKVTKDIFYIMGGRVPPSGQATKKVYSVNMKEQNVQENVGSLLYARTHHACAVIPSSSDNDFKSRRILITGGSTSSDEIFDVVTRSSKRLSNSMKVRRMNHRMVTLGKKVFALGGQRHLDDDTTLDYVEVFNNQSESWSPHLPSLLSKTTNGLAVTELPLSAVSCNKGCKCGDKSGSRIVGGTEAEVMNKKNPIWSDSLSGTFSSMVGSAAHKREERYLVQPMCSNTGG